MKKKQKGVNEMSKKNIVKIIIEITWWTFWICVIITGICFDGIK
jgi:hypothetical protein